jgi:hypothetical protein
MDRTDAEVKAYITEHFFTGASSAEIDQILALYPSDPAAGSPFDTGDANAITPEFKRMAAFIGDVIFQAPRRFLLQHRSHKQPTFAFCSLSSFTYMMQLKHFMLLVSKRGKSTPVTGAVRKLLRI